ncbi:MAG: hypothetical protein COA73_02675 [Candidatus Hydrogenedentota bacterium]|nr:MAG: hypothetical protein COA73_02675 [Candidatus Hydrogenedentota bacterium]
MQILIPSILNLITAFVCFSLGLLVLARNSRKITHRTFAVMAFNLMLWAIGVFCVIQSPTVISATFWVRFSEFVVCFTPALIYHYIGYFPRGNFVGNRQLQYGLYIAGSLLSVYSLTPNYLKYVVLEQGKLPVAVHGNGLLFMVAITAVAIIAIHQNLWHKYRESSGFAKRQVQFVLTGTYFIALFGILVGAMEPVFGIQGVQAYGPPLTVILLMVCFAYAMIRYHLLDTRAFVSKLAVFIGSTMFVIFTFGLISQLVESVYRETNEMTVLITTIFSALVISMIFQTVKKSVEHFIEVRLLSRKYDVDRLYRRIARNASDTADLEDLLESIASDIQKTVGVRIIRVLLIDPETPNKLVTEYTSIKDEPCIQSTDHVVLLDFLRGRPKPLILEKILHRKPDERMVRVASHLAELDAYFCLPLTAREGLVGLLTLGQKDTHDIYSNEELLAFRALVGPLGTAITNARLYREVERVNLHQSNIFSQMQEGVIAVDNHGCVTMVNEAANTMAGPIEEGQSIDHLTPEVGELLIRTLDLQVSIRDFESNIESPEGEVLTVLMSSSCLTTSQGETTGAIALLYDLSQIKRLERNVQRADRLSSIGTLAAGMAHEIKNPLVSIKTFTQLLMDRYTDPDFRNTFRDVVPHEVDRIDTIVTRLLDFARPRPVKFEPQNIRVIIEEVLALVENQTRNFMIDVKCEFPNDELAVYGDEQQLHQVFLNLILNAVDAMEAKKEGVLSIITRYGVLTRRDADSSIIDTNRCVDIYITDTGSGMGEKSLQNLFTPFYTTKDEGCGLGLSVVHSIIMEHGGTIDVQSTVGVGTTFTLALPMAESLYSTSALGYEK